MEKKELLDDRPMRVDVQAVRQSIKRSERLLGSGINVERLDRDLADSNGLRRKRRGEQQQRDERLQFAVHVLVFMIRRRVNLRRAKFVILSTDFVPEGPFGRLQRRL